MWWLAGAWYSLRRLVCLATFWWFPLPSQRASRNVLLGLSHATAGSAERRLAQRSGTRL